jgi:cytosine/adenosine deaminase-related metal-dependent hydrolase
VRFAIEAANMRLGIEAGRIVPAEGDFDFRLRIPDGMLRPGLINAHDHLHRNHYGRLGSPPYQNAYQWADDVQSRFAPQIAEGRRLARRDALLRGAWKNLLCGVTTVVHHDRWEEDFERDFPINVARIANADSLGRDPALGSLRGIGPFSLHLAEGVDQRSADEVQALDDEGLLNSRLIAVHAVGVDADGVQRLRACGCAITWCPTSNQFLFGRTLASALVAEGIDVMLGTDSLLSGAGDLLDELRAARRLGHLSDERLKQAVGEAAARRLGLPRPALELGAKADLAVFRRSILEATVADVVVVVVSGELRVLDPALVASTGTLASQGRFITMGNVPRWLRGF